MYTILNVNVKHHHILEIHHNMPHEDVLLFFLFFPSTIAQNNPLSWEPTTTLYHVHVEHA